MRRSVSINDITTFAHLDMIYNQIRVLEAKQNSGKYKCLGSGECCKIGLTIPMMECANIAFHLRQEYYLKLESVGEDIALAWMDSVINSLKLAMQDDTWQPGGETKRHCAFYDNGCTIYQFRPLVCRSFGTITTVDDFCPRIRNENGAIDHYGGEPVKRVVEDYQMLLKKYSEEKDGNYNLTVYMPLGVLSFLLTDEELLELKESTDDKFWNGIIGWFNYRVEFTKVHGFSRERIESESQSSGIPVAFKFDNNI
jgi:Fe-S-cluster containining protein